MPEAGSIINPIKFLLKEDVTPSGADRFLHFLAPVLAIVPVVAAFAVIPFGDVLEVGGRVVTLQAAQLNVGVLYVLAMAALGVYGVVLAGWASNNRWSLLGGIRGSAQMISYELAMGLALISAILVYGTVDLQAMVRQKAGGPLAWGVWYQPVGLLLLLTAGIAESKRVPFDLPESESELISGYFTEYSIFTGLELPRNASRSCLRLSRKWGLRITMPVAILMSSPAVSVNASVLRARWRCVPDLSFVMSRYPHWMFPSNRRC